MQEGKGTADPPTTWCAETPIEKDGRRLLFWRGVDGDGADASVDQVTLMTDGPPPTLNIAPDMGSFVDAVAKGGGKARWAATLEYEGQTLIFGYFDGRPAADASADLFARALSGEAKPVGAYAADGKTITIGMPPKP